MVVVEEIACSGVYQPVDEACVVISHGNSEMGLFTEGGLVVSRSVVAGEQLTVLVQPADFRVITGAQQVTIPAQGTVVCVFVVRRLLHTITWGPWFKELDNPWANFARALRSQPGGRCLLSASNVSTLEVWRSQLCGQGEPIAVYSGISNFHGNVSCSKCKRAFWTIREWRSYFQPEEGGPQTIEDLIVMRSALQRMARVLPPNLSVEESQQIFLHWCAENFAKHRERILQALQPFLSKYLEDVPFLCPEMCCLSLAPHPYNHGEAYILIMPSATAEEDEPTDEDVDEDEDLSNYSTRIHAVSALLYLEQGAVPSVLTVLQSCNAAFEPSLCRAFQKLGSQYVLGYIKPVWNFTSGLFIALVYTEWEKRNYECGCVQDAFLSVLLNENEGIRNFVRDTMPVLFLPDGSMICFDFQSYLRNTDIRQALRYAPNQRPFWIFDFDG